MIGYLAPFASILGMYLFPTRKRTAVILYLIGNVIWLVWGLQTGSYEVVANYILMGILNVRILVSLMRESKMVLQGV